MTSEEILRANNVYDKILSEPLEIYNAFIEYFGEDLVDMIYPSFSKIIENHNVSDMSESKIFETIYHSAIFSHTNSIKLFKKSFTFFSLKASIFPVLSTK